MAGFFSKQVIEQTASSGGCSACKLFRSCGSPRMGVQGAGGIRLMLIDRGPGHVDDSKGKRMCGPEGRLLTEALDLLDLNVERDCWKTGALDCHIPDGREPTDMEIQYCRSRKVSQIRQHKPHVIITFGNEALESILAPMFREALGGVWRWRGWTVPLHEYGCWLVPTYDMDYLIQKARNRKGEFTEHPLKTPAGLTFIGDLRKAVSLLREPLPAPVSMETEQLTDVELLHFLRDVRKRSSSIVYDNCVSFDYETTSLKPDDSDSDIISVSFCDGERAVASLMTPKVKPGVAQFLADPVVKKIAHNAKFEERWTRSKLGVRVAGWLWDPMLAAHWLDNRTEISGLKFQALARFGIPSYDHEAKQFMEGDGKRGGNSQNRLRSLSIGKLLHYNGLDSRITWELAQLQMAEWETRRVGDGKGSGRGVQLLLHGTLALASVEEAGVALNTSMFADTNTKLICDFEDAIAQAKGTPEWGRGVKMFGRKWNALSGDQVGAVLVAGGVDLPKTKTGKPSTKEEHIAAVGGPFVEAVIRARGLDKLRGTYLNSIRRETDREGYIHPSFNLFTVTTYRGSCDSPNFQNIPIRDPEAGAIIRSLFRSGYPGGRLLEVDYGGIEVKVAACYCKDPTLIAYIKDPTMDMHRDVSVECYDLPGPEACSKDIRYCGKNKFTFPQFYGSWWRECAKNLWTSVDKMNLKLTDGTPLRQHLRQRGFRTLAQFEEHIKKVERDFWDRRFHVYRDWRAAWWEAYRSKGYFDTLTGFRCSGVMEKNDVLNYPIQGSAFHCLLWSLIQLERMEHAPVMVGQIHDSIIFDLRPDEDVHEAVNLIEQVSTRDILKEHDWIIVPLEIEAEVTPPDGNWAQKEKVKR